MTEIIITMTFEAENPLTNTQKQLLRDIVENIQGKIAIAMGGTVEETCWELEQKSY